MYSIRTVLIGLDFSDHDKLLMQFTEMLCHDFEIKKVHFVHIEHMYDIEVDKDSPIHGLKQSMEEPVQKKLEQWVKAGFKGADNVDIEISALEGSKVKELIRTTRKDNSDLIILGKKSDEDGTGIVPEKISRKAPCSVMIVPECKVSNFKSILIPTDYSVYSLLAFESVKSIKEHHSDLKITAINVAHIPWGYYSTGKSFEEVSAIMLQHARHHFADFVKEHKLESLDIEAVFKVQDHHHYSKTILKEAKERDVNLIMIGAKGLSAISSLLLGSITESLIKRDFSIPVMVLKKKNENIDLIDTLLSL